MDGDTGKNGIGAAMTNSARRTVALEFCAVAVAFFFSFVNISCNGQRVASLTGVQLALGTTVDHTDMFGNQQQQKVAAEPLAMFALIAAAAGALLALIGPVVQRLTPIIGVVGALRLLMLVSKFGRDATAHSSGLIDVSPGVGLIAAVLLFLIAGATAAFSRKERAPSAMPSVPAKLPDMT